MAFKVGSVLTRISDIRLHLKPSIFTFHPKASFLPAINSTVGACSPYKPTVSSIHMVREWIPCSYNGISPPNHSQLVLESSSEPGWATIDLSLGIET
jgi:hypothetical protein